MLTRERRPTGRWAVVAYVSLDVADPIRMQVVRRRPALRGYGGRHSLAPGASARATSELLQVGWKVVIPLIGRGPERASSRRSAAPTWQTSSRSSDRGSRPTRSPSPPCSRTVGSSRVPPALPKRSTATCRSTGGGSGPGTERRSLISWTGSAVDPNPAEKRRPGRSEPLFTHPGGGLFTPPWSG